MKEYLDIDALSEYLAIKKSTLYAKVERAEIPYYKIGHLVRFKKTEIDRWLEGLRHMPFNTNKKAGEIMKYMGRKKLNIDGLIKKSIASVNGGRYTLSNGKLGHSLGEEV